ncbi:MAG: DNA-binding protein [Clostridia bacterium]|nr:DNA-binding protein [Clostridia bacterium]
MDKISFIALWDLYRGLLTPTQQEITDLYFNLDLSLSEIAEQKGVSRQAVSECLKTCKKQLEEYEEKLGFRRTVSELCLNYSLLSSYAGKWAEDFKTAHPEFAKEASGLAEILAKDYSAEARNALSEAGKVDITYNAAVKQGLKVD